MKYTIEAVLRRARKANVPRSALFSAAGAGVAVALAQAEAQGADRIDAGYSGLSLALEVAAGGSLRDERAVDMDDAITATERDLRESDRVYGRALARAIASGRPEPSREDTRRLTVARWALVAVRDLLIAATEGDDPSQALQAAVGALRAAGERQVVGRVSSAEARIASAVASSLEAPRTNPSPAEWALLAGQAAGLGALTWSFLRDARGKRLDQVLVASARAHGLPLGVYLARPGSVSLTRLRELPPTLEALADQGFHAPRWDARKRSLVLGIEQGTVRVARGRTSDGMAVSWLALPGEPGGASVGHHRAEASETRANPPEGDWRAAIENLEDTLRFAPSLGPNLPGAVERALQAGAKAPLRFLGAGQTAVVFCNGERAFKVARWMTPANREGLAAEAEWLRVANQVPGVREHVARFYRWHPDLGVIERECVKVQPGRRFRGERDLEPLHRSIERALLPYGLGAPELKADSYVMARGRGPVLVDAGFAPRVGTRLARHALGYFREGRAEDALDYQLEAGAVRRELGDTLPTAAGQRVVERLYELRPEARWNPPFQTPARLRSCVGAVAERTGDTSGAFAICTASLQRAGDLAPGTRRLTAKGRVRDRVARHGSGRRARDQRYERALRQNGPQPPASVRARFAQGVALVRAGKGGRGLRPETVRWAERLGRGEPITVAKARKMAAWLRRHGASPAEVAARLRDPESPAAVAWLLWGGDLGTTLAGLERDPALRWAASVGRGR